MYQEIIKKLNSENIIEDITNSLKLKELRSQINQNISARLKLLNYKPNQIQEIRILNSSFSVYKHKKLIF